MLKDMIIQQQTQTLNMKYLNSTTEYKKVGGKVYEITKKEVDISSIDNDIIRERNTKDNEIGKLEVIKSL